MGENGFNGLDLRRFQKARYQREPGNPNARREDHHNVPDSIWKKQFTAGRYDNKYLRNMENPNENSIAEQVEEAMDNTDAKLPSHFINRYHVQNRKFFGVVPKKEKANAEFTREHRISIKPKNDFTRQTGFSSNGHGENSGRENTPLVGSALRRAQNEANWERRVRTFGQNKLGR